MMALTLGACAGEVGEPTAIGTSELAAGCAPVTLRGVDVSHHNGNVDWAKVKASGKAFAFARTSDGLTTPDTQFTNNWPAMERAGITRGVYQFFRARRDGVAQADLVLRQLAENGGLKTGDLPPVLDLETNDGHPIATVVSRAKAFLDRLEAVTGVKPIVYTGNHMTPTLGNHFAAYPLWVAHYETECPRIPPAWNDWTMWQDSESGTVPGIGSGGVDTNFFKGNQKALDALRLDHDVTIDLDELTPAPTFRDGEIDGDSTMGDGG